LLTPQSNVLFPLRAQVVEFYANASQSGDGTQSPTEAQESDAAAIDADLLSMMTAVQLRAAIRKAGAEPARVGPAQHYANKAALLEQASGLLLK
jgi:hypothetical protein